MVSAVNEIWSTDFVSDALYDGRRLRALTVVANYTRECLTIEVGQSLKGEDVVRMLNRLRKSGICQPCLRLQIPNSNDLRRAQ